MIKYNVRFNGLQREFNVRTSAKTNRKETNTSFVSQNCNKKKKKKKICLIDEFAASNLGRNKPEC